MSIKVFKRYEYKYILDEKQYAAVLEGIRAYSEVDPYCIDGKRYCLYNIYYDTQNYSVIRHSVSKPYFKEKLRLRSYYPDPEPDDKVFVELKKKCAGCVNKRRITMKYKEALSLLETGSAERNGDFIHDQVLSEIECYMVKNPVIHKTYLAYDRYAFFLKEDKKIRITFDSNLRAGSSFDPSDCKQLLPDGKYIMEIKLSHYMPVWLARLLSENKVYRHGFSKYGTYYKEYILPERIKQHAELF
ncbi:MAG: polyphosphate polymerase domain-containing protein [Clostridia bacterium]|nr:polyphosphate polymerase domain-containing protein [Clostridia bacterium]